MSVTIYFKGLQLVCESPSEAAAIAQQLAGTLPTNFDLPFAVKDTPLKALISKLGPNQKKALRALAEAGGRMRDADLVRAVGVDNVNALAATFGPIYKLLKAPGVPDNFFSRELSTDDEGKKTATYVLAEGVLDEVKSAVKKT